jgi:hypothetical protein
MSAASRRAGARGEAEAQGDSDMPRDAGAQKDAAGLPAWKVILAMIRFRPGLWLMNTVSLIVLMIFFMLPGLVSREFFNLITG